MLTSAGLIGVALAFGAQNLLRDLITGTFIIMEDQVGVGDVVDLGVASGTVEDVSLRTTRLRDVEGVVWYVPNGAIPRVGNKSQQWSRAVLDIPVSYTADIDRAQQVIAETAFALAEDAAWTENARRTRGLGRREVHARHGHDPARRQDRAARAVARSPGSCGPGSSSPSTPPASCPPRRHRRTGRGRDRQPGWVA